VLILDIFLVLIAIYLLYSIYSRNAYVLLLFIIFIFSSVWRLIGAFLIDFWGPVYADELFKYVGGSRGVYFFISILSFIMVLVFIKLRFREKDKSLLKSAFVSKTIFVKFAGVKLENWVLCFLLLLHFSVLIETIKIGQFPLLSGLPRWRYVLEYAGPITKHVMGFFVTLNAFLHGYLYIFFKYKYESKIALRLVILSIIMQEFIFFAQGNKFTTPFFSLLWTFSIISIVFLKKNRYRLKDLMKPLFIIFCIGVIFAGTLYRVYIVNRGYTSTYLKKFLYHRLFIAPNQLNYDAIDRAVFKGENDLTESFDLIFVNRLPMGANPSINYLMYKARGPEVLNIECGFTDAYPGILFELGGGLIGGLILEIIFAIIYVFSMYKMIFFVALGRLIPATFFFFIAQAGTQINYQGQFPTYRFIIKLALVSILYFISIRNRRCINCYVEK